MVLVIVMSRIVCLFLLFLLYTLVSPGTAMFVKRTMLLSFSTTTMSVGSSSLGRAWKTTTPGVPEERESVLVVTNMWTGWPAAAALALSQHADGSQRQEQTAEELPVGSTVRRFLRVESSSSALNYTQLLIQTHRMTSRDCRTVLKPWLTGIFTMVSFWTLQKLKPWLLVQDNKLHVSTALLESYLLAQESQSHLQFVFSVSPLTNI